MLPLHPPLIIKLPHVEAPFISTLYTWAPKLHSQLPRPNRKAAASQKEKKKNKRPGPQGPIKHNCVPTHALSTAPPRPQGG